MQLLIICNFTTIITIEKNGTKIWYFDPHFITNLRQLTQFDYLTPIRAIAPRVIVITYKMHCQQ